MSSVLYDLRKQYDFHLHAIVRIPDPLNDELNPAFSLELLCLLLRLFGKG